MGFEFSIKMGRQEEKPSAQIYVYKEYEYEQSPMFFLVVGDGSTISMKSKAKLLKALNSLYGDTPQETTEWALEYELWSRMLLFHDALCINPKHLELNCNGKVSDAAAVVMRYLRYVDDDIAYLNAVMAREQLAESYAAGRQVDGYTFVSSN